MRAAIHIFSLVLVLPYLALAAAFLELGHAIAAGSLPRFFWTLLNQALWLVPWGAIAIAVALILLAALGLDTRARWVGALVVGVLAAGSLLVIILLSSSAIGAGELLFLAPCFASLACAGWLLARECPFRGPWRDPA